MKPDKFYDIEDLEKIWAAWDITEKDLLKYGAGGTLQFSIKKEILETGFPDSLERIEYFCPSLQDGKQKLCSFAANQTFFKLSPETIEGLRHSKAKSLVILLSSCLECENQIDNEGGNLRHNIIHTSYFYNNYYEPVENLEGIDTGLEFLNDRYCQKKDLLVSKEEKEKFEIDHLKGNLSKPPIAKPITLLRVIGALLIKSFNKPPYIGPQNKVNASKIADAIGQSLAEADMTQRGIENRKLREIISEAFEVIHNNKN